MPSLWNKLCQNMSMMHQVDWLAGKYLILCMMPLCNTKTCNSFFKVRAICGTNYGTTLSIYNDNQSKSKCALACSQDGSCLSSVYDDASGLCKTFSAYKTVEPCASGDYYAGVFQSTCHTPPIIPGQISSYCEVDSDCYILDSECRSSKCQCFPGLSYDPVSDTCVTNCTEYGKTYQEDLGHLLVGFNDGSVPFTDLETCMHACAEESNFVCRSIEVWRDGSICYFSKETASTQWLARKENSGYDIYQRDCAPA